MTFLVSRGTFDRFNPAMFHVEHYFSRCFTWNTIKTANSLIFNQLNKFDELHKNIDIKVIFF